MRKVLFSLTMLAVMPVAAAFAADMPLKAPPPPAPAPLTWTGCYFGGEFGYGWATEQVTHVTGATSFPAGYVDQPMNNINGALGGLYAGCNYQFNNSFLVGIDGDFTWAGMNGTGADVSPFTADIAHHSAVIDWISTATGRIGYVANNWLLFAKGGGAWSDWGESSFLSTPAGAVANYTNSPSNRAGWTVGGGVEWAYSPHVLLKIEYDFVDFDTAHYITTLNNVLGAAAGTITTEARSTTSSLSMVKAGIAYKF
jgi:outer membrane immunogenic protein